MVTRADAPKLLDVMTRHQIYLEAVKRQQGQAFNNVVMQLRRDIREIFLDIDFTEMRQMTRRQLERFVKLLRAAQIRHYNVYTSLVLEDLRRFMEVDMQMNIAIMQDTQENKTEEDRKALAAMFLLMAKPDKVWSKIIAAPLPANGMLPKDFLARFTESGTMAFENLMRKAWANNMSVKAAMALLVGTSRLNYRDAQLTRSAVHANAVTATLMQHAAGIVQAAIASQYFEHYRWISVLDSRTSEICRSRDGHIYNYSDGPLPPAHVNCRSKTEPVDGHEADIDESYAAWLQRQPQIVKDDIASVGKKPLTLTEFVGKLRMILAV